MLFLYGAATVHSLEPRFSSFTKNLSLPTAELAGLSLASQQHGSNVLSLVLTLPAEI
jgi:hypothetical protein